MGSPTLSPIEQLKRGRRHYKIVEWPKEDGVEVALRVLTEFEIEEANREAWKHVCEAFDLDPEKLRGSMLYERERGTRMLLKAMLVAKDVDKLATPFSPSVEVLKKNLSSDERKFFLQELADFTAEQDPNLDTDEGKAIAATLVEELKKKGQSRTSLELLLRATPPGTLRRSLRIMVGEYQSLRKAKSSPS